MKINSISAYDENYPSKLRNLSPPPSTIYTIGEIPEKKLSIAIVGTRKPTNYGRAVTEELAGRLAERGAVIISGLAYGIDSIAQESALKSDGQVVAVLPSGLDRIYPANHRSLAERIVQGEGSLVSEYPAGTPPLQYRFLERNRLVSGLADVVIVTEASLRSGTTNTVSHALEQGKDIYAVPGPITSPMSAGCNNMIAQGAQPITNIESFVDTLMPLKDKQSTLPFGMSDAEQTILELIGQGITDGDALHSKSALDGALYAQTMTMLEIRGAIKPLGANRWSL